MNTGDLRRGKASNAGAQVMNTVDVQACFETASWPRCHGAWALETVRICSVLKVRPDSLKKACCASQLEIQDSNISSSTRSVNVFPDIQGQDVLRLESRKIDEWLASEAFTCPPFFIGTIGTRFRRFQYPHRWRVCLGQYEQQIIVPGHSQTTAPRATDRADGARVPNA